MTLDDLGAGVASATGMNKMAATKAVSAALDGIQTALRSGEKVTLTGFGVFEIADRSEREGRNPQTGAAITIAASKAIKFKPGKGLREAVNA